jgi:OmpA-OmpF porin, OOP family
MMSHLERKEGPMLDPKSPRAVLSAAICLVFLSVLVGCAGWEFAPKRGIAYYPKELPAADRAVEAARQAGRDKECPEEFNAAEKMKNDAYDTYLACHTKEGIAMAIEAANKAAALCPRKVVEAVPTPVPVRPSPPPVTVSLSASPASIREGQCATLTWSSGNASSVSIDPGVGRVNSNGSQQVCPDRTTQYTIAAAGGGESRTASTTVTVQPKVVDRLTIHVNFDFNKAKVRKPDDADLQKAIDFVKKYSGYRVSLEGYTDNIGSNKYNLKLSERRAVAVKDYLVKHGVDGARIRTSGHGKADPVATNSTEAGRFQNRRVEILILSE